ncbi:erythrose-4-phosphate dehydrogenase [Acinetobacter sp. B10A]|uniref:type I glyceraldehyde-3-phosphate dehydrogenase n=1 Tax=Acinetobacter baretiae TaxID=2605383 RepID=UPI001B3C64DC|nr:glyceraldehyde 3-phosphate dehydrogenase NAD-binding domain-containing protein [Acinetobacter baretiae]MBF7684746.1 erythrose-4-phosphate dehydrogenase [Acinetobacter baretiae]
MQRIGLNGFGRIGRNVVRAWFEREEPCDFVIAAVNDVADIETLAHLFKYDSTHGTFKGTVQVVRTDGGVYLEVIYLSRHLKIQFFQQYDPAQLPWQSLNIDVALECTGLFRSYADASKHLHAGANRVIVGAAPFDYVDAAIVYGVNHEEIKTSDRVISSVSCTTQALVPLVKVLDDHFGIESALMTEVHAVTTDQAVLDHAHRDLRRARASGHNIIPTTSSALGALKRVMPKMENRIHGYSIRVPTLNVAAIDLTFVAQSDISVERLNQAFEYASTHTYSEIMACTSDYLVSSDFNHLPQSLIVDLTQTMVVGRQAKVYAWYDNEWGYANRLLDLSQVLIYLKQ